MRNFKAIYKILKTLDKCKGREDFDYALISAQAMKLEYAEWEQLMIELQISGYIRGLVYTQTVNEKFPHIVEPIRPQITMKGMEYLENNSMLAKAKDALRMAGDII